jgi:protein-S-isoprenylcysteine O-methyltransferase Ste14
MAQVQGAESRREWVFRLLSVAAPGAGHLYAGRTFVGALVLLAWCGILSLLAASQVVWFTEVASRLVPPWPLVAAGVLLAAVWILANRLEPEFEVPTTPTRRPPPRRARTPLEA